MDQGLKLVNIALFHLEAIGLKTITRRACKPRACGNEANDILRNARVSSKAKLNNKINLVQTWPPDGLDILYTLFSNFFVTDSLTH